MNRTLATRLLARSVLLLVMVGSVPAGTAYAQQTIGTCTVLPANNIWNTPVDSLPVLSNSAAMVTTIGTSKGFHADFGAGVWNGGTIGIPFITVPGTQPKYPAAFYYASESDAGPYAIPLNAPIEGGSNSTGDRHAIAVDTANCLLYELYNAFPQSSSWNADSGAIFDLKSNALRPAGWTTTDAAGLPIMPGLVTYEEVQSGEIKHAIRVTAPQTRREYVWPARHYASSLTGTQYPRMGERFRLKAGFNISSYPADVQVILRAMKKYGIMLADNGSAWFISGKPDARWNDDNLHTLGQLLGANFEAVDATVLRIDPNSGAAIQNGVTVTVSPSSASVRAGRPQTFAATVSGAPNTVTWSVNGIAGGDAIVGVIDASGRYFAPSSVSSLQTVTVRAASTTSSTSTGSALVTILPLPSISSVSPSPLATGNFTLTVTGVGYIAGSVVSFDGAALATTFVSSTRLTANGYAPTARPSVPLVVNTPDGEVSNTLYVSVTAPQPGAAAAFVRTDSTTQGTWRGKYGAQGSALAAEATSLPAYTQLTLSGQSVYTWTASTTDVRALQRPAASDRFAATWYRTGSFTFDLNLTDASAHQVALYGVDWDAGSRTERIEVLDAASGTVLDTRTLTNFVNGQYLVWTITGHVVFRVTLVAGGNAVISGFFIDPSGASGGGGGTAAFVRTDGTTQGTWRGKYGAQGSALAAEATSLPAYAQLALSGQSVYTWTASTTDVRALQRPAASDRFAATWYRTGSFTFDLNLTDASAHQVALYGVDWDAGSRTERIEVLDAASGAVLDTRTLTNFVSGQYLVWTITGHVVFRVTLVAGGNAVISGFFVD